MNHSVSDLHSCRPSVEQDPTAQVLEDGQQPSGRLGVGVGGMDRRRQLAFDPGEGVEQIIDSVIADQHRGGSEDLLTEHLVLPHGRRGGGEDDRGGGVLALPHGSRTHRGHVVL